MKVAVLGSSGGMGSFFARYFLSGGLDVVGSDSRKRMIRNPRFRFARSNAEAVRGADIVLVATPVESTVETVRAFARYLAPGACVIEITSVKGRMLRTLKREVEARKIQASLASPALRPFAQGEWVR